MNKIYMDQSIYFQKKTHFKRYIFVFVFLAVIFGIGLYVVFNFFNKEISINQEFLVKKGDNISIVYDNINVYDKYKIKIYNKLNKDKLKDIKPGIYTFSGTYSPHEIVDVFNNGPEIKYKKFSILEGWSKYDIDYYLYNKGFIGKNEYVEFISDKDIIDTYSKRYDFVNIANKKGNLKSLEGFLYPDTYYIDPSKNIIDQLVYLQLDNFKKKVWNSYSEKLLNFDQKLKNYGFENSFDFYDFVKLSSIIELEENVEANKPLVAGILLNKLFKEGRVYADVTLCYGLEKTIKQCTGRLINNNINDGSNLYNTRKIDGLPPTPIGNPSISTIKSLLNFQKTNYMYYLHDKSGNIYPSTNYSQHILKKSKHVNN